MSTVCTADGHPELMPAPLQGEGRVLDLNREHTTCHHECWLQTRECWLQTRMLATEVFLARKNFNQ